MINVVVCGGSGLIGQEICKNLIKKKINVINFDLKKNTKIKNNYILDLSSAIQLKKTLLSLKKKYKKIHALVVCIYPRKYKVRSFFDTEVEEIVSNISHHTNCYLKINKEFSKIFMKQKFGSIINFSSIYGSFFFRKEIYFNTEISEPTLDYMLSKNLLTQFSKFLAKNLKKYKVRVNVLSPGGVFDKHSQKFYNNYGKHTLFGKMLLPKDLNDIVCFLISEKSKNITGQEIIIDSGFVL